MSIIKQTGRNIKAFPVQEGMTIDSYEVLSKIGMGGMGVVYQAKDKQLNRMVALKFLISEGSSQKKQIALDRFLQEQQIMAQMDHPNIIKLYHASSYLGYPYLAMEFVEGKELLDYIESNSISIRDKLIIVKKTLQALHYAHRRGVIHRDVKPSNILIRGEEPLLMDFGISRTKQVSKALTRTGEIMGTPHYMAPEQAQGLKREIAPETDVYAMGGVLYHLLVGHSPVRGNTILEKIHHILHKPPIPPREICQMIPKEVENICLRALEKKKEHRYPSARAFIDDIDLFLKGKNTRTRSFYRKKYTWKYIKIAMITLLISSLFPIYVWMSYFRNFSTQRFRSKKSKIFYCYESGLYYSQKDPEVAYTYFHRALENLEKSQKTGTKLNKKYLKIQIESKAFLAQFTYKQKMYQKAYHYSKDVLSDIKKISSQEKKPSLDENGLILLHAQSAYRLNLYREAHQYFSKNREILS